MIDHAFDGQIPRRLVLTMVKSDAYNGDLKLNPYEFQHNRLNYLAAHINGIQYPSIPYTPDFDNNIFTKEFLSIFETLNIMTTDCYLNFNRGDFKSGCAMFGFNFASDSCDDYLKSGYIDPKKEGTMGFHLKFKSAPTSSMVLVIYAEFDNFVEIDINRQVTTDYH